MRGHLSPQDEDHDGGCRARRKLSARVERCLRVEEGVQGADPRVWVLLG